MNIKHVYPTSYSSFPRVTYQGHSHGLSYNLVLFSLPLSLLIILQQAYILHSKYFYSILLFIAMALQH